MPRVAGTCRRYDVVVVFVAVVGLLLLGHAAVAPCGDVGSLLLFVHVASLLLLLLQVVVVVSRVAVPASYSLSLYFLVAVD
jgi:hypothetical protein